MWEEYREAWEWNTGGEGGCNFLASSLSVYIALYVVSHDYVKISFAHVVRYSHCLSNNVVRVEGHVE